MRIMALPHTEANRYFHIRRAHLQMMLWKAADQQRSPKVDIGSEVKGVIPTPCGDTGLPAPQGLIDVINCGCKSEGKARSTGVVTATKTLSIVHALQPMGDATHIQRETMHTRMEMNKQSSSSSLFRGSGVSFVAHSRNGH